MRITLKGDTNHYSLKVTVLPICWDSDKYKVSRKEIKHEAYNKIIAKHLNKAENIILRYMISDKELSLSEFDKNFRNKFYDNVDFFVFVESEFETRVKKSETLRMK